jgi:hypothetical protein
MSDYEQFKKLLEKSNCDFKEFNDKNNKYLCFSDSIDSEMIIVADFKITDNSIFDIYLANEINNIDDFENCI